MSFSSASNNVVLKTSDAMNNSLDELFEVVINKSSSRQKPLTERQLPRSFFVPPSGNSNCPSVSHFKAFSSPATLEETYRAGPGQQNINHFKQRSLDSQNGNQHFSDLTSVPNIEMKSHSPALERKPHLNIEIKELPVGYEMAINGNCQVYFLNHNTKETTWFDPRLPETIQKWGMTLNDLQELHIRYINMMSNNNAKSLSQTQHPMNVLRSPQTQQSQSGRSDQTNSFNDPKSQTHFRSCSQPVSSSGTSLGGGVVDSSSATLNNFQMKPVGNLQYFVNQVSGGGSMLGNYQDLCRLHPHCSSSVQGSLSHSNNSSCSNLSTCLNGLNLSPLPSSQNSGNSILLNHSPYTGHASPGLNVVAYSHSHQDSLDSGVGQSVVSQSQLSSNTLNQTNDPSKSFDYSIKYEEADNFDSCTSKLDDFMDIDFRQLNY
uniref:YKI n=1 Tax=Schmidtea mediterranea TaxID=79327 RepID=W8E1N2_SCHMD|nr:YKI [Schmidtea mediterranea]